MPPTKARSLFITYDGLLDPLGSSQILPYLLSIAPNEDHLHILSFEKPDRYIRDHSSLRIRLLDTNISWSPVIYTRSFGVLGKCWDLILMYFVSIYLVLRHKPSIVHARGHSAALPALLLQRIFNIKLLFDFRGLWVDERVDKGNWNLNFPFDYFQFSIFKRLERQLLSNADHVVALTYAVIPELLRLGVPSLDKITVIPCCADFNHFQLASHQRRTSARLMLDIPSNGFVLGWLGSVGGMYLSQRFLEFVASAYQHYKDIHVLALTPDRDAFKLLVTRHLQSTALPRIHIHSADRHQVAEWLPAIDVLVSLIAPTYARLGASPTKLAEAWACGIPTLCNSGIGDVTNLVRDLHAGMVIDADSAEQLHASVIALPSLIQKGGDRLRSAAKSVVSLSLAAERYNAIYRLLRT